MDNKSNGIVTVDLLTLVNLLINNPTDEVGAFIERMTSASALEIPNNVSCGNPNCKKKHSNVPLLIRLFGRFCAVEIFDTYPKFKCDNLFKELYLFLDDKAYASAIAEDIEKFCKEELLQKYPAEFKIRPFQEDRMAIIDGIVVTKFKINEPKRVLIISISAEVEGKLHN